MIREEISRNHQFSPEVVRSAVYGSSVLYFVSFGELLNTAHISQLYRLVLAGMSASILSDCGLA